MIYSGALESGGTSVVDARSQRLLRGQPGALRFQERPEGENHWCASSEGWPRSSLRTRSAGPFERRFRDAMSASQHLQAMMPHVEMVGRHILGVDNPIQHI